MTTYRVQFFLNGDPQWYTTEAASPEEALANAQANVPASGELRNIFVSNIAEPAPLPPVPAPTPEF